MDVPLGVDVRCVDEPCGKTTTVILNPITTEVTHVVVKDKGHEYLVPLALIVESTPVRIQLRSTYSEFTQLRPFVETQFLGPQVQDPSVDAAMMEINPEANVWPYVSMEDNYMEMYGQVEQVPHDELAIHRGSHVEASDGHIGQVDEFIVDPTTSHISHLVLRENQIWGTVDITLPVSEIERIEWDTVYLKLDKKSVRALPSVPVRNRFWK